GLFNKDKGDSTAGRELTDAELEACADAALRELGLVPRPPPVRRKTDWTVQELYRSHLPPPVWVVAELLPAGLASLAGRPKVGKSLLALQLAAAVALGRPFLGYKVKAGPVLYLALEDSPQRLRERLRRLDVAESAPIEFYTEWPPLVPEGLYDLQQCLPEMQPRLVVVDTLSRALAASGPRRVQPVGEALAALQQLAWQHNCCLLTVDHHRKGRQGRDVVDDLQGSTAKAAALDTIWGLYATRGQGRASLCVTGREVAACELALEFDEPSQSWQLGSEPCLGLGDSAQIAVWQALQALGGVASTAEIAEALGMPPGNVSRTLAALVSAGWARRLPREGRRVPYKLLR
ncbi:MAG: MarR family transcriptional regulator, partial [Chloroflexi bacterium]|nr:MarR family transcriptional regulator [Chloroflexota bacterium]